MKSPGAADDAAELLLRHGMSQREAARKGEMFARCEKALGSGALPWRMFVPGRVELLGKHVDYAGGRSLLLAVERGICVSFVGCAEPMLHVQNVARGEERAVPIGANAEGERGHWSSYAAAVCRRLATDFPMAFRGLRMAFLSDLPVASGLSSSSALVVAFFLAVSETNKLRDHPRYAASIRSPENLAEYLGAIEGGRPFAGFAGERGIGTMGGSEDHTAILCCRAGQMSQFSFAPVRQESTFAFPDGYRLLIASSGVQAEKGADAQAHYNRVAQRAQVLLEIWNAGKKRRDGTLAAALESASDAYEQFTELLRNSKHEEFSPEDLQGRLDQFVLESKTIVPAVAELLATGRVEEIGGLVEQSQRAAEQHLQNQIPETEFLVRSAQRLGAVAASAFGAGWGGSVWALCQEDAADAFLVQWRKEYAGTFPPHAFQAEFFATVAGPPAFLLRSEPI